MPQAAVAAIGNFLLTVFGGYTAAATAAAYIVAKVFVYAATQYLLNRAAAALTPRRRSNGLGAGAEINYFDTGAPIRIVYGQVKTGGMETIPPITSGENREFLHKVITLAGHEVDSYNAVDFDGFTIPVAAIGPVAYTQSDGQVNSGGFRNFANIRLYRGTSTDSLDRILAEANSPLFGGARGRGIAKAMFRFKYEATIYRSVPTCTVTYQGKRCYDPRLDVTPGASPANASYIAWTRNPALCLCDYLMAVYGGEYDSFDIDWDTVVTAANYCDGLVNIPGSTTQRRYTCNGVLYATDPFEENVKALVDAMLGRIIFRDGKWRIYAGSWQTPSFTIQKSDWLEGGLAIKFERGRGKRFNEMRCWFIDRDRGWQRMECTPRSNATYKAADGGELISAETEQLLCTDKYEAQRKAEFLLRQSRNQIIVSGRLPPRFQNIALWDTGTIVFDHLGWSSKTFRCMGVDLNPDGSMDCVFAEEQSSDWTDLASSEYNTPSTAALPEVNATTPSEPQGLSVTPQINGTLLFYWTRPVVQPYNTKFQIIRSTNSVNAAVGTVVWEGDAGPVPLVMPTSRHWYYVRAVANSAFSPYQPNTAGVMGQPYPPAVDYYAFTVPDPGFDRSADLNQFWMPDSFSNALNVYSLSLTGGLSGGRMTILVSTADGGIVFRRCYANLFEPVPIRAGPTRFRVTFRVSSVTNDGGAPFTRLVVGVAAWTGVGSPNESNVTNISGGEANMVASITSAQASVGNWYTIVGSGEIKSRQSNGAGFFDVASYPYAAFYVAHAPNASAFRGVIEVDEAGFFYN